MGYCSALQHISLEESIPCTLYCLNLVAAGELGKETHFLPNCALSVSTTHVQKEEPARGLIFVGRDFFCFTNVLCAENSSMHVYAMDFISRMCKGLQSLSANCEFQDASSMHINLGANSIEHSRTGLCVNMQRIELHVCFCLSKPYK